MKFDDLVVPIRAGQLRLASYIDQEAGGAPRNDLIFVLGARGGGGGIYVCLIVSYPRSLMNLEYFHRSWLEMESHVDGHL